MMPLSSLPSLISSLVPPVFRREEEARLAARLKEREEKRQAFLEIQQLKAAAQQADKEKEMQEIRLRAEEAARRASKAEAERNEKWVPTYIYAYIQQQERERSPWFMHHPSTFWPWSYMASQAALYAARYSRLSFLPPYSVSFIHTYTITGWPNYVNLWMRKRNADPLIHPGPP